MFIPNQTCKLYKKLGSDAYGKTSYGAGVDQRCSVIQLTKSSERTTVRTDAGASHGNAKDTLIDAVILFNKKSTVAIADKVSFSGFTMVVVSVWPRFAVGGGKLDHYEVNLMILENA